MILWDKEENKLMALFAKLKKKVGRNWTGGQIFIWICGIVSWPAAATVISHYLFQHK